VVSSDDVLQSFTSVPTFHQRRRQDRIEIHLRHAGEPRLMGDRQRPAAGGRARSAVLHRFPTSEPAPCTDEWNGDDPLAPGRSA